MTSPMLHPSPSWDTGRVMDQEGYVIRLLSGSGNRKLSESVSERLGLRLVEAQVGKFSDGETRIEVEENIRGSDVFIIQPTCPPTNDNVMELLLLIHTLKLASAKRITAVVPYFGYGRQDRKVRPRVPISASAVAHLIESMGPSRLVTVDLHCGQIQGFFRSLPVDNLFADDLFIEYFKSYMNAAALAKTVLVSPDAGAVARARHMADLLGGLPVVTILKRRVQANQVDSMQIVGEVDGLTCIIADDMIDTAGTLTKAAELLRERGAATIYSCATHGVFSGDALARINSSVLAEVLTTDTIPQDKNVELCPKLKVLTIAPLLARAISHIHAEASVSGLFSGQKY